MMKYILIISFLLCSTILNAYTSIVSWNPPAGGLKNTYTESQNFSANTGDVLSCRCYGMISSGSSVNIYLTANGVKKQIYSHSQPRSGFDEVVTFQFIEDGTYSLSYEYKHNGGGTAYYIRINATMNDVVLLTELTLDTASLILNVGERYTLVPTVIPDYASNKTIEWSSSNESIVKVSSQGELIGQKAGAALITASTTDGTNLKASCKIVVKDPSESHDYVDLGLPSGRLWATMNIGASKPEDRGYTYCWGELFPSYYNARGNSTSLQQEDDVACQMWGENWHIPTKEDFEELIYNCSFSFDYPSAATSPRGYIILTVTSRNGNSLLLPQPATFSNDIAYWTSTRSPSSIYCYYAQTSTNYNSIVEWGKNHNLPVRPVSDLIKVRSISVASFIDMNIGDCKQLEVTVEPSNATEKSVVWQSSDTSVVSVNDSGYLLAKKKGTVEIKASTIDGTDLTACCYVVVHNPVTSITLDKQEILMQVGSSITIEPICLPHDADDMSITWKSSNNDVITVENGVVKAKSVGMAYITAVTVTGISASCKVTVVPTSVSSLSLNTESIDLVKDATYQLICSISPEYATNKVLVWTSLNNEIASVNESGLVTAISTGVAVITATTTDGTNLSASCTVNVTNPVIALTLDRISAELMVGQQMTLQATCTPSNADNINVSWSSNNEDIASVNNGVVIAKGLGDAIITARSVNGIEATCKITVVPTPVTSLSLNTTSVDLIKDATYQLVCNITPEDATNKGLVWTSLNSGIASVNESGLVTAMSTGTTTIIVSSASNSEITASCTVNVTTPVTSIKLEHEALELLVDDEVQLIANCMPSDADNANVVWSTTNGEIAIVSQDGYITAKNEGDALITVTTTDGTNLSASCQIHVKRHKQMISWSQETMTCQEGGEMIVLEANSNSGLPISFNSSEPKIVSIFDLGDIVYANPIKEGKTVISAYQQGNYKYEPAEAKREIEVIGKPMGGSRTLVAYYSQSALMDGIVAELTNQIASSYTQVYTQKIEPSNARIDMANHDTAIRDSVMNVIFLYPDDAVSYPEIKPLNVAVGDYDDIILVYPIWNMSMAAPMQTFCFQNRDILESKSVAYIEYDLFDEAGTSSNAQVLRLCPSNIADKKDLIKEWLDKSVATGILQFRHDKQASRDGIYDLQGRKISNPGKKGLYIIKGHKMLINDNGGTNR